MSIEPQMAIHTVEQCHLQILVGKKSFALIGKDRMDEDRATGTPVHQDYLLIARRMLVIQFGTSYDVCGGVKMAKQQSSGLLKK
ncbi:hypothetical protein SK128_001305 [Halocaridina rubra]|uniref:Uncharacterized protein n=1 Tax=Halocaridina rubra TaxID=373956 RepID=A0AAN8WV48_HALRR